MELKKTMKNLFHKDYSQHILVGVFCGMVLAAMSLQAIPVAAAENPSRGNENTSASQIFDEIIKDANPAGQKIQDTALDDVNADTSGKFSEKYRLANTLESIRKNIAPYLQWFLYAALAIATILIIITGLQLVTSAASSYEFKKATTRLKNIAIGVAIFTGAYFIIKIFLAVLVYVLK